MPSAENDANLFQAVFDQPRALEHHMPENVQKWPGWWWCPVGSAVSHFQQPL